MKVLDRLKSSDGMAIRFIQMAVDHYCTGSTYVNYHNKHIICYSTQIGCANGCRFCYNGLVPYFVRNMTCNEIVDQVKNVINLIDTSPMFKPFLFSAMGIGEPLNNYENYVDSVRSLNELYYSHQHKFALSTSGSNTDNIRRLAHDLKDIALKLQISLHSASPAIRKSLMPKSQSIEDIMEAVVYYQDIADKQVEFNITLINGVNDSKHDALQVCELFKKYPDISSSTIKINKFNRVETSELKESLYTKEFMDVLREGGLNVEYYETNGADVNAACGQMGTPTGSEED